MQSAFVIVVIAVGVIGILGAVASLLTSRRTWESLGRDRLLLDSDLPGPRRGAAPRLSPAEIAERDAEARQMLAARNARRRRRGEPELDVEAELARLTRPSEEPSVDAALRTEIRELVIARNHRRRRRGRPELDVDTEVAREIARLRGGP